MYKPYNPANHYWFVGGRIWSSAVAAYIEEDDPSFVDWGGEPTAVEEEKDVFDALDRAGLGNLAPGYVPKVIALWQAREQIRRSGLFDQVNSAMQQAGGSSLAAWEYGTEVWRDANIIQQFKSLLGMTDSQIDQMFFEASRLKV